MSEVIPLPRLDVTAEAEAQLQAQREAFMARAKQVGGAAIRSADEVEITDYDKQLLSGGHFQIRGSLLLTRTADIRAQLVAIRNAATEALLILDRPADPIEKRQLIGNKMRAAGKQCLEIRRAAGETWAK